MARKDYPFDLDIALATWRQFVGRERALLPDDLDELEQHVRDQIGWLRNDGLTEEEAFRKAMRDMGEPLSVQQAYRDVFWAKMRHQRSVKDEWTWRLTMAASHFKLTLRTLNRHRLYSAVTIVGLSVGLAAFLLIGLFVRYEQSYDRFHADADRLYRVIMQNPGNAYLGTDLFAYTPIPLLAALENEIAGVEVATQISDLSGLLMANGSAFASEGLYASPTVFDVFTYPLLAGSPSTALDRPGQIVLTRSMAVQLFGKVDVVGQRLQLRAGPEPLELEVTGVVEDPPPNSHFSFDWLLSISSDRWWSRGQDQWNNNDRYTYFKLQEGADPADVEARIAALADSRVRPLKWYQTRQDEVPVYSLQRVSDIHLHSRVNFDLARNGDIQNVWMMAAIGLFILLLGCINYTNLATARASNRQREVGIRQVSGAQRSHLVGQFLGESFVITGLSLLLAVGLVALFLPSFAVLAEREIPLSMLASPSFVAILGAVFVGVSLLSGLQPAWRLSRQQPSDAIKGVRAMGRTKSGLRNALVVFQYAVGIVLIVGTLVVRDQLHYLSTAETGFSRDQILAVQVRDESLEGQFATVFDRLQQIEGVEAVSGAAALPTRIPFQSGTTRFEGNDDDRNIPAFNTAVSYGWIELLGLEIVEGRSFSADRPSDEWSGLIINESVRELAQWESAVGKQIEYGGRGTEVIGVVKDFNFQSFRQEIEPLILYLAPEMVNWILVKVDASRTAPAVAEAQQIMASFSPAFPFEYQFLDDAYDAMYRSDERFGRIFSVFAVLSLIIACLGLFALSAFMADQRRNEIGVRKALGATTADIVGNLSADFLRLVLVSFVIGAPAAWWVMERWLEGFAYRTPVSGVTILLAGIVTLAVAWCTVAWQSIRAARTNPAEVLRQS